MVQNFDEEDIKPTVALGRHPPLASTSQLPPSRVAEGAAEQVTQNEYSADVHDMFATGSDDDYQESEGEAQPEPTETPAATPAKRARQAIHSKTVPPRRAVQAYRLDDSRYRKMTIEDLLEQGAIDLNPDYQREAVVCPWSHLATLIFFINPKNASQWHKDRSSALIHTFFHNSLVPALVFNERPFNSSGVQVLTCIDGKQRLTSILRFFRGEIVYKDFNNVRWVYTKKAQAQDAGGKFFKVQEGVKTAHELTEEDKALFRGTTVHSFINENLELPQEKAMFRSIQQAMELKPAEKTRSIESPFSDYGYTLEDVFSDDLSEITSMERANGYVAFFTVFLWIRNNGTLAQASLKTESALNDALLLPESEPSDRDWKLLKHLFSRLNTLTKLDSEGDKRHPVFSSRQVSPIEFLFLPMLIHHWSSESDGALLEAIEFFRAFAYKKYKGELKKNTKVFRDLKEWILHFDLSELQGKYDNSGRLSSATAPSPSPPPTHAVFRASTAATHNSLPPPPPPRAQPEKVYLPAPPPSKSVSRLPSKPPTAASRKRPHSPPPVSSAPAQKRPATNGGHVNNSGSGSGSGTGSVAARKQPAVKDKPVLSAEQLAKKEIERKNGEARRMLNQGSSSYGVTAPASGWPVAENHHEASKFPTPTANPTRLEEWRGNVRPQDLQPSQQQSTSRPLQTPGARTVQGWDHYTAHPKPIPAFRPPPPHQRAQTNGGHVRGQDASDHRPRRQVQAPRPWPELP